MADPSIVGTPSLVINSGGTSKTDSHLNPTGGDIVIIAIWAEQNAASAITSVSYGGVTPDTVETTNHGPFGAHLNVYAIDAADAPTEGSSHNLAYTVSDGGDTASLVIKVQDCDSEPANIVSVGDNTTVGTSVSNNITPSFAGSLVIDFFAVENDDGGIASDGGQTDIFVDQEFSINRHGGGSSYKSSVPASSTAMGWSCTGSDDINHVIIALAPGIGTLEPTGIASGESFGTSGFTGNIQGLTGISSAESFGAVQNVISIIHNITGITSAESFGTPQQLKGFIEGTGIASGESFGTTAIRIALVCTGIPSGESFGTPQQLKGFIEGSGIGSAESFGTSRFKIIIAPDGVASNEAFGVLGLVDTIVATGIASGESFGLPTMGSLGSIIPTGITSGETFGSLDLKGFISGITGIPTGEVFGTPMFVGVLSPTGIGSTESFGGASILITSVVTGITSAEAFGTPALAAVITPTGITSAEAFGSVSFPIWVLRVPTSGTFTVRSTTSGTFVLRSTTSGTFILRS